MKYNPHLPLTEEEQNQLDDETLFRYLDSRVEYYKQYIRPLDTYHTKKFIVATKGGEITDADLKLVRELGRIGDEIKWDSLKI